CPRRPLGRRWDRRRRRLPPRSSASRCSSSARGTGAASRRTRFATSEARWPGAETRASSSPRAPPQSRPRRRRRATVRRQSTSSTASGCAICSRSISFGVRTTLRTIRGRGGQPGVLCHV
ncbi:MAG: Mrr restriction system protein, partial [uncultured Chloroflexia bacterium]